MKILFGLTAILLLLSGCYTEKKAQRKLDEAYRKKEIVVANFCSTKYPIIQDSVVKVDTLYSKGEVRILPGEVKYVDCPPSKKGERVACPPCPDQKLRVDTVLIKSKTVVTKEDSARIRVLGIEVEGLQKSKAQNKELSWTIGIMALLIIGLIVLISKIR